MFADEAQGSTSAIILYKYYSYTQKLSLRFEQGMFKTFNMMINEKSGKKKINKTNLSPTLVPVGLDFSAAKGTTRFAMQIFWFPTKLDSARQKSNKFQLITQLTTACSKLTKETLVVKYSKLTIKTPERRQ